jgi:hypothetical protein
LEEDGLTAGENELQSRTVDAGKRWGIREDRFRMKVGESDGVLFLAAVDEAAKEGDIAHASDRALAAAEDGAAALCTWLDRKRELDEVTGEKLPIGAEFEVEANRRPPTGRLRRVGWQWIGSILAGAPPFRRHLLTSMAVSIQND